MKAMSRDVREHILKVGGELVAAKGFNGCGLTEILKAAGVPKGSFYHYFASKEEFGVALIERARDEHLEWLKTVLGDRRRSPLQRLRAVFQEFCDECQVKGTESQCLIPKMALETSQLSDPVHAAVKSAYQQWGSSLAQVIREAQAAGEVAQGEDPDHLAGVLVMLWEGAAIRMEIDRSTQPLQDFLTFVFETMLPTRR
jgi:TetR/AcrR family transcriptional repressor of nem operon